MDRRVTLQEYKTTPALHLTSEQRQMLTALAPSISVVRTDADEATYDLTPGSWIGGISLPGLQIEVRPKIPINRVMFILSYALDPKHWWQSEFDFDEDDSLLEAIVPGFAHHLKQATRRGLLQGYRTQEEALATVRGRIRFDDQIKRRYGIFPPIEVRFDEFTEDIEENRLLKAAIERLGKLRIRSEWARGLLRAYESLFTTVSSVNYRPHEVPEVTYTRLNMHYRPALAIAKLIIRSGSWELREGRRTASAFLVDMNDLFEDFVVASLREALRVTPAEFPQGATGRGVRLDAERKIRLKPDLSWWQGTVCTFVGDVKYKKAKVEGIENPDVYQLLAYTVATNLGSGLLIYAAGEDEPATYKVNYAGKQLQVVTLDLAADIPEILQRVNQISQRIRAMRQLHFQMNAA